MITYSKSLLLFFAALFTSGILPAQQSTADSLRIDNYYNQLARHCYTNLDSTLYYLDLLLEETHRQGSIKEAAYAYLWGIFCTGYQDQIDLRYELLSNAEQLLRDKGHTLPPDTLANIDRDLQMNWGDYYMETGGYNGALEIYERLAIALEAEDQSDDAVLERLAITNQYLSTIHRLRGSYREAIDYSFRALKYERQYYAKLGRTDIDESQAYSRIANAYWLMGEQKLALHYYRPAFDRTLQAYRANPEKNLRMRKRLITMGQELGGYYRESARSDSALYYLEIVTPLVTPDAYIDRELLLEKSKVWYQLGQYAKAQDSLQLIIAKTEKDDRNPGNRLLLGKLYTAYADVLVARQAFPAALRAYQRALKYLVKDFNEADPEQNPKITAGNSPQELLSVLTKKTKLLLYHPPDETADWLLAAWSSARAGMDLVDNIKESYTSDYDKQYLLDDSYELYELALDIILRRGREHHAEAFAVMENSKAIALYTAVRDLHARDYAGVPEAELEKVRRLQYQLSKADAQLDQANTEDQQIAGREHKLALKQAYDTLIHSFEVNYPEYFRLKYDQRMVDLADLELPHDQLMIEYFIGDHHLYAFSSRHDGSSPQLFQLPWDAQHTQWVIDLRNDIYQQEERAFATKAYALYQALLEPVLTANPNPKSLLIVPDGVLGYLPFDILLTEAVGEASYGNFRDYPFLLRKLTVSQNFSLTMLREMQLQKRQQPEDLLAFAPSFPGPREAIAERNSRAILGELVYNQQEAAAALASFDGRLVADRAATKEQFLELASRYRIYHIASHAVVDDEAPNHSYIAFAAPPDSLIDYSRLYSYEILAHTFPAELVVLSACETGVGKVVRGEGIMSLARAFSYAGARSMVTSLWNINDQSGQELMAHFYEYLSDGLSKDEALRQAKLAYLDQAPDKARTHPRYWAAFVPMGNMEALTGGWPWQWGILVLAVLGGVYLLALRKRSPHQ